MLQMALCPTTHVSHGVPRVQIRPDDCWIRPGREKREEESRHTEGRNEEDVRMNLAMKVDEALEQFINTMGNKIKISRRTEVRKRVAYRCRRMRCGAPAVTRQSFSEEDLLRFNAENDGFPIAANEDQIREFEDEVFSGDARLVVGDAEEEVKRKSRSKSLSEVAAFAKLLKLPRVRSPSKPKFLDKLISNKGVPSEKYSKSSSGGKRGRHLLANQDDSADRSDQSEDEEAELVSSESIDDDTGGATGYLQLKQDLEDCVDVSDSQHHALRAPLSEPCSPVFDRDNSLCEHQCVTVSPPLSPILPGLVKQRCESYNRFHEESVTQAVTSIERARSHDRGFSDSPRVRRGFSPVSEKTDRWIKGFYSLSRDESFSKAVMERGYVRALAEQINTGTLPARSDDEEEEATGSSVQDIADMTENSLTTNDTRSGHKGEEEVIHSACTNAGTSFPDRVTKNNSSQGKSAPEKNLNSGKDCNSQPLTMSPPPCDKDKPSVKRNDSSAGNKKRDWSPRVRRKSSDRPRSPPPAIPSKPRENTPNRTQPPTQCSNPDPQISKLPKKSSPDKPPVDHASKPKVGALKPAQSSNVNGDSSAHNMSPGHTDAKTDSPSMSSSQEKGLDTMRSDSEASDNHQATNANENVFTYPSNITPHELFDMSWSDSESDYSDSEVDLEPITAQQASDLSEAPPSTPKDKLHQIALELLTTERAYVKRLSLLHQTFYFRIDQENRTHGFLPGDTLTQMFSSIQSIHQFHNDFLLREVEDRMKNWEKERRIGDLMKKNAPFLKLYTAYVKNFDNAMNLINLWLEKSQKFASIVQEIQKLPECGCLTLQHHMLEPIQRVPRYEMLLKDYLKHLPDDSPDRPDAQAALDLVTKAASHSNEAMKKIEKFHRLLDIYQRLRGVAVDFISPTRDFVREGPITKISARSGEKQSRYLFLFNDLLLICSEPLVGAYRVRAQLDVDGMEVKQANNIAISNTFLVHSKQKAIELLEEQPSSSGISWFEELQKVIEDLRSKKTSFSALNSPTEHQETTPGKQAPRWIPDDAVTMCMLCQQHFTAFRRRHHCRACGKLICKGCCKKAPLEYMNNKLERVCLECHDAIVFAGRGSVQSPGKPVKRTILQVKADDPGLLAGYLNISDDVGRSWNKRWFSLHDDFVMYFFKARQDVSAYHTLPLPGYLVEVVSDADKPNTLRVYHKNINKKGILFQADNDKLTKKWVNMLNKLVLAQLPDDSQRLSSQSNSSSASSGSDTNAILNNNNNTSTSTSNSDKLSQADSCFTADSVCDDSVAESPIPAVEEVLDDSVTEKS